MMDTKVVGGKASGGRWTWTSDPDRIFTGAFHKPIETKRKECRLLPVVLANSVPKITLLVSILAF